MMMITFRAKFARPKKKSLNDFKDFSLENYLRPSLVENNLKHKYLQNDITVYLITFIQLIIYIYI